MTMTRENTWKPSKAATRDQLGNFWKNNEMSPLMILSLAVDVVRVLGIGGIVPHCTQERFEALVEEIEDELQQLEG